MTVERIACKLCKLVTKDYVLIMINGSDPEPICPNCQHSDVLERLVEEPDGN